MLGYATLRHAIRERVSPLAANKFLQFAPPGHFYSPIPDADFVRRHRDRLFDRRTSSVPGIDVRAHHQLALIEQLSPYFRDLPFTARKSDGLRYYFENGYFQYADAIVLHSLLRGFQPRRVIEVGSGFSSAVMLDTNDRYCDGRIEFTFIDPFPARLISLLRPTEATRHRIIELPVQDVPPEVFAALERHDVLFIDSSHMVKVGSDVGHLLTDVLPALQPGVLVHFHDVLWPFEYPEEWIQEGRAWNECYVLRAFLQFNAHFQILLFNSYLALHHADVLERCCPLMMRDTGGSLWLLRTN
jgi:predicted O-methyltransferase YrrM